MEPINTVYQRKEECCGCGACASICPSGALQMKPDEIGFLYPSVDAEKCIGCKLCQQICAFGKNKNTEKNEVYAMTNINDNQLMRSSSGGIFLAIASPFISNNDTVCGSAVTISENTITISHELAQTKEDLYRLCGSKYVQSNITKELYRKIRDYLKTEKKILFSGTPCQVAQMQSMFGDNDNFYAIDIICHGVPSQKMLNDWIKLEKNKGTIKQLLFRNKENGWGLNGNIVYEKDGTIIEEPFSPESSSFYGYFLNGHIYRENCYFCPYANTKRCGDLTLGDYWGVEKYNPEILSKNGGMFDISKGISCVFVNSKKGHELMNLASNNVLIHPVKFDDVVAGNSQLQKPANRSEMHDTIMHLYKKRGYKAVNKKFKRDLLLLKIKYNIRSIFVKDAK